MANKNGLDKAVITNLLALGGVELLTELKTLYVETSQKLILEIHEAVKKNQPTLLKEKAHSLKSSSGNMGALHLYEICHELENIAQSNNMQYTLELVKALDIEFNQVKSELAALVVS